MQLFMAIALDCDMNVVILCCALAHIENIENWMWFLSLLMKSIYGVEDTTIPFISDLCKGLLVVVRDIIPEKTHTHCINHLKANVKKNFGKATTELFMGTVYTNNSVK